MSSKKNILVAPLNWGLGHATRCIPIIKKLISEQYNPIIASDGSALDLLKLEFPSLKAIRLPSYHIQYPKKGKNLKWKLVLTIPRIIRAVNQEKKIVEQLVLDEDLYGIISDNRFGAYSSKTPSVYITHQLNVFSGWSTFITSKIHQKISSKFNECWVPDNEVSSLSGKLTQVKSLKNLKFIGPLSRFKIIHTEKKYDLLVLLSGVEPSRTKLEQNILQQLENFKGKVLIVQGKLDSERNVFKDKNLEIHNYMLADELELAINQSSQILSRSGYSTIMDMAKLQKKCFFIPTPGQTEQEYLAGHLHHSKVAPYSLEKDFKLEMINRVDDFSGFENSSFALPSDLFHLFQRK